MGKKYLISKEYQGDQAGKRDPCKFMLKTTTDGNVSNIVLQQQESPN